MAFRLTVNYTPKGDQAAAIDELVRGVRDGEQHQVLLGVTGSGKTFTMAKVIEAANRPALVLAHNKTLAAQLYHEFKTLLSRRTPSSTSSATTTTTSRKPTFPPATSTSRRKPPSTTSSTSCACPPPRSLFERRDCVIVASVSCIYGLGSPEAYYGMLLMLEKGQKISREEITAQLVEILYERNDGDFRRGTFRVRGDVIEIYPTYDDNAYRIELWGDEIEIAVADRSAARARCKQTYLRLPIYPKTHYVMQPETREQAPCAASRTSCDWWKAELEKQGKLRRGAAPVAAHHVRPRDDQARSATATASRTTRATSPAACPAKRRRRCSITCPHDCLLFIDESHQTIPQLHGMYHGDRSRKETLVDYGFRLPSALDNRPLTFEEFEHRVNQVDLRLGHARPVRADASPPAWWSSRSSGPPA